MEKRFTLANGLTALRLVLAPVFLVLYVQGNTVRALATFAAAAATDVLDGLVARALDQKTRLGAVLDPIADKLLAACALFALAVRGRLPWWLPVLALSRDLAMLIGAWLIRRLRKSVPIAPTRIGKYATFWLTVTVLIALSAEFGAWGPAEAASFVAASGFMAAECIAVSWVQYFLYYLRAVRVPWPPPQASR